MRNIGQQGLQSSTMTAIVRDEENGKLIPGSPVHDTFDQPSRDAEPSDTQSRRSSSQSSWTPCLDELDSSTAPRLGGDSMFYRNIKASYVVHAQTGTIKASWSSRLKKILHLQHRLPEGYSFDIHPVPRIPSCNPVPSIASAYD